MVDLGGYVIILVETRDKKIKLYGEFLLFSRLLKKMCDASRPELCKKRASGFVLLSCWRVRKRIENFTLWGLMCSPLFEYWLGRRPVSLWTWVLSEERSFFFFFLFPFFRGRRKVAFPSFPSRGFLNMLCSIDYFWIGFKWESLLMRELNFFKGFLCVCPPSEVHQAS